MHAVSLDHFESPFVIGVRAGAEDARLPPGSLFLYSILMAKSISRTEKSARGRPVTNPTSIHLTLTPEPLAAVDQWIADQMEPNLTRPQAIRRLVELGLKAKTK